MSEQTPTAASAWSGQGPEIVTLPSGNIAQLRKPSLLTMMRRGEIPNPLLDAALEVAQGRPASDWSSTADFIGFLVAAAFVTPRVVHEGEAGESELHVDALGDDDKTWIVGWIKGEVDALEPFRPNRAGAPPGGDERELRSAALEHVGPN